MVKDWARLLSNHEGSGEIQIRYWWIAQATRAANIQSFVDKTYGSYMEMEEHLKTIQVHLWLICGCIGLRTLLTRW